MDNNNEPIITVAGITAAVTAVLALLTAFGLPVTPDQQVAIIGVVGVLAPIVVGFISRKFAVSLNRVEAFETKEGTLVAGGASPIATGTPVNVSVTPSE